MNYITMNSYFISRSFNVYGWWGSGPGDLRWGKLKVFSGLMPAPETAALIGACVYAHERRAAEDTGLSAMTAKELAYTLGKPSILDKVYDAGNGSLARGSATALIPVVLPDYRIAAFLLGDALKYFSSDETLFRDGGRYLETKLNVAGEFVFPSCLTYAAAVTGVRDVDVPGYRSRSYKAIDLPPDAADERLQALRRYIIERTRACATGLLLFYFADVLGKNVPTRQLRALAPELFDTSLDEPDERYAEVKDTPKCRLFQCAPEHDTQRAIDTLRRWLTVGRVTAPLVPHGAPSAFLTSIVFSGIRGFAESDPELEWLAYLPVPTENDPALVKPMLYSACESGVMQDWCIEL